MAHLTLTGVSDDGQRLLLVNDAGEEFTLDIDARLRAALRGDTARLGQLETTMDSALRPRDIQARIRAGETPEAVAQAAQTTVDKIMAFAAPVLAERQHVADRAQRSSVRRRAGADQSSAPPAPSVTPWPPTCARSTSTRPRSCGTPGGARTAGGRLTGEFGLTTRSGTAEFTFDMPGNYVVARQRGRPLAGRRARRQPRPAARDDLAEARQRRLSAVRPGDAEELPLGDAPGEALGDDAIELVTGRAAPGGVPDEQAPPADEHDLREQAADAAALDEAPEEADGAPTVEAEPIAEPAAEEPLPRPSPPPRSRRRAGRCRRAGPRVGAELGRDHVRRRQVRVGPSRPH